MSDNRVKIAIFGATGQMGKKLLLIASKDPNVVLVGAVSRRAGIPVKNLDPQIESDIVVRSSLLELETKPDVVIDFSLPEATMQCVRECVQLSIPLVIGTTGLTSQQDEAIKEAQNSIPLIHAMNYSLGVNLLCQLVAKAARQLGRTRADLVHGREGSCGKRTKREVGMHAVRLGSVVGDHTVMFGSEYERIEVTHRAQTKDVFAAGAVRAAKWLKGKPVGRFAMEDVLGL